MVLKLLAEPAGFSDQPSVGHPHGEVVALDVRGGDPRGTTCNCNLIRSVVVPHIVVVLHQSPIVHETAERSLDGFQVGSIAVSDKLDSMGQTPLKVVHEGEG